MAQVEFAMESWEDFWPDAEGLLREEFTEYAGRLGLWKPHSPDVAILAHLVAQGRLVLATARVNGVLGAYLMWLVDADVESTGHTVYRQGPFYASRRFARHALGVKLLRRSIRLIRTNTHVPVEVDLHHPPEGRGLRLGGFFQALGARPVATHYRLRVDPYSKGT